MLKHLNHFLSDVDFAFALHPRECERAFTLVRDECIGPIPINQKKMTHMKTPSANDHVIWYFYFYLPT